MLNSWKKFSFACALVGLIVAAGLAFGLSRASTGWKVSINGRPSPIPIHTINNMYFVSLADLAKLPGWRVTVDLGRRSISLIVPAKESASTTPPQTAQIQKQSPTTQNQAESVESQNPPQKSEVGIEAGGDHAGPPNNVRMTVHAALASLDDLRKAVASDAPPDALKQKRDQTAGIVQQADNLLWSLPRTRTLQADLQVALEDLQSQINLVLTLDQTKDGLLPWTHPVAQSLLLKYPDLHPCHITKGKTDGLDVACARKMMTDLATEDFSDVERDLEQYK